MTDVAADRRRRAADHWTPLPPLLGIDDAARRRAPPRSTTRRRATSCPGPRRARRRRRRARAAPPSTAEVEVETTLVEHAYIEPEAGYARRVGDRIELSRQHPDAVHGPRRGRADPRASRRATSGSSRPPAAAASAASWTWRPCRSSRWRRGAPTARCAPSGPGRSRWPRARSAIRRASRRPLGADADGRLTGYRFHGDFDTGAYASWGPTVANRVPVHAMGPYACDAVLATTRAIYTNNPPAGAFRGFGVPAGRRRPRGAHRRPRRQLGQDRLEFRLLNALRAGSGPPTGQRLTASAGLAGVPGGAAPALAAASRRGGRVQRRAGRGARGSGVASASGPCGTASATPRSPNPSTIEMGITRDGRVTSVLRRARHRPGPRRS